MSDSDVRPGARPADVPPPFELKGVTLSHYKIGERIGTGGMGVVYEAEDTSLLRKVALKILPPWSEFDENAKRRFVREARAASSITHANVCTVYEYAEIDGQAYLAMEYVDGPTLRKELNEGPVSRQKALTLAARIAAGLAEAHTKNVVHRDIKPGNIILTRAGEPKITDFGVAKINEASTITRTGLTLGTVAYMSPEQAIGDDVGAPTDVWSLGVVLYEMLMGERPFPGEHPSAVLYSVLNLDPRGLDALELRHTREVRELVAACLDKDPASRPTAAELSSRLAGMAIPVPGSAARVPPAVRFGRKPLAIAAFTIAVVLVLVGLMRLGGDGVSLQAASIAMLPVSTPDSSLRVTVNGFISSMTSTVKEIADQRDLVANVVWYQPDGNQSATPIERARGSLGVEYVIETEVATAGPDPVLRFTLRSAVDGSTVDSRTSRIVSGDWRSSYHDSVREIIRMLGYPAEEDVVLPPVYQPSSPGVLQYYTTGMGLIQERTVRGIEAGIALLNRALQEAPDYAGAYAGLCKAYVAESDVLRDPEYLGKAERLCDRAIELDPTMTEAYLTLGNVHIQTGRYGQAASFFGTVMQRDPTNADALIGVARINEESGNSVLAESLYQKAVANRPDWDSYRQLGIFYYFQSRYDEALKQLHYSLELAPLNPSTYANLGAVYWRMEDFELAEEYWLRAIDLEPDYKIYNNLGGLYFFQKNYASSARMYERALDISDGDYLVWGNLGTAYRWAGEPKEKYLAAKTRALRMAERALEINPRDTSVMAKLAGYHAELGDTALAIRYLDMIGPEPDSSLTGETIFEAGTAMEAIGLRSRALSWIDEALERGYSRSELMRYPGLDALRNDTAFQAILSRHNTLIEGEG